MALVVAVPARADAPLSQGFEDGAAAWGTTGMWHVQTNPESVRVIPAIRDQLVTLPDDGYLPAAVEGSSVAWFGEAATGTYCGSDFASVKQSPKDGCTSAHSERGALTSPSFSLAGRSSAYLVFRAWWEIEAVNADIADQMRVEYSTDDGASWVLAGSLNPLSPSWGGNHQPYSDSGARQSGAWASYSADLSPAAGSSDVRVRFVFDTIDARRNGFRGLLLDGVAVVDPLGATITEPQAGPFTDAPPALTVDHPSISQDGGGGWHVKFGISASHPSGHPVGTDWTVRGGSGAPVGSGHATLAPGQTTTTVDVPVSGADAPYTASISNPTGGTVAPGGSASSTPGGALPLVGIDSLSATAGTDGVAVAIGVRVNQPAVIPVSVDYTLTGSDGVVAGTGTLSIPVGGTVASTTVTAPSDHAPYTVGLSNARGALLDPSSSSSTTSPLAGVTSVLDGGSQLVLGARTANIPTLRKTFFLTAVSGTIKYHTPGGPYKTLPKGTVELPMGSVVDATAGHALITVEVDNAGTVQQVEVWEGKTGVFQVGSPVITELRLAGGDYTTCVTTSRKRARRSADKVIRHLWASGKGRFRTKGRFASATIRGTQWDTEDLCLATRITVTEGVVGVFDFRRKRTTAVPAGHSLTISALNSARYRGRRGIHAPKLARIP